VKIHEYQAKSVLARFGVPVPRGEVVFTPSKRARSSRRLGGGIVVVQGADSRRRPRQGRRRQARQVADEAEQLAKHMIGMTLVTHQTGPRARRSAAC
jgi:succinyl-CoA synthetase beta subunit